MSQSAFVEDSSERIQRYRRHRSRLEADDISSHIRMSDVFGGGEQASVSRQSLIRTRHVDYVFIRAARPRICRFAPHTFPASPHQRRLAQKQLGQMLQPAAAGLPQYLLTVHLIATEPGAYRPSAEHLHRGRPPLETVCTSVRHGDHFARLIPVRTPQNPNSGIADIHEQFQQRISKIIRLTVSNLKVSCGNGLS